MKDEIKNKIDEFIEAILKKDHISESDYIVLITEYRRRKDEV